MRWVFISHDDHDHIGNLPFVLEQCPNATLVCSFSIVPRLAGDVELPLERMRWVDPGRSFDVGDRTIQAVRPPMFDSPATRGLFDATTGLFWAADSFGTFFPGEVYEADDIPADLYDVCFTSSTPGTRRGWSGSTSTASAPTWPHGRTAARGVASAHGPVHRGARIDDAFRRTLDLAGRPATPTPGQDILDLIVSTVLAAA